MDKKRVSVQIEGRNYVVITTDDEKYVRSVAKEVTDRIRKAAQTAHNLDTCDCAIYAAMDLCDDRNKAVRKNKDVIGKADKIIRTTNDLNKQCAQYKDRLTETINENTHLTKRVMALEKQLKSLTEENEILRKAQGDVQNTLDAEFMQEYQEEDSSEQYSLFDAKG